MQCREAAKKVAVTALGLGLLPVAPGTWASAGGSVLYLLLVQVLGWPGAGVVTAAALALCFAVGLSLWRWAADHYGQEDPAPFVLDEVAGQWGTYLLASIGNPLWLGAHPLTLVPAIPFIAFRVFDVWKPFPIRRVENAGGRWGTMLDDLVAALYAGLASRALIYVWIVVFFPRI